LSVGELLLVRHAAATSNRAAIASCALPGGGLTDEGVVQGRALRDLLESEPISLAVSSRLSRTQETLALALGGRLDVPTIVVPDLDEIDFGSFDGGRLADYRAWAASRPPDEPAPGGGESRAEAAARFARGVRAVLDADDGTIALFGHALAVRYVVDAANGLVPASVMAPVAHAVPYRLARPDALRAAELLTSWSLAPRFRDPPTG
jgi:broad specificity phosphatase PhoE